MIENKKAMFDVFAKELRFPENFQNTWESFEACLEKYCYSNLVVQYIHFEKIENDFLEDVETLKRSVNAFNTESKFKIDILV